MRPSYTYLLKKISMDTLLSFYDEKKVEGYCKHCPCYGKRYSCPPFSFDKENFLKKYTHSLVVGMMLKREEIPPSFAQKKDVSILFDEMRAEGGEKLLLLEKKYPKSLALLAGTCTKCQVCEKEWGRPCKFPLQMRLSLESLGILVSALSRKVLDKDLLWYDEGHPAYYLSVAALLLSKDVPFDQLRQSFWAK